MYRQILWLFLFSTSALAQIPIEQKKSSDYTYYFQMGEKLFEERNFSEALIHYNESLILNPLFAEAYHSRAITREKLEDKEGALRDYTIYLELNPDQFDALFSKALINFEMGKWLFANQDFKKLITLPAGETTTIYFGKDRFSDGINQVFTSQGADKSHIYNYLGLTEFELKQFEQAIIYFDSATKYNPHEADYFVNKGKCFEQLNQDEKARLAYQTAVTINPEHSLATHNISVLNRKTGDTVSSELMLDEVISKNPDLHFPYAERAFNSMNAGAYRKALSDYNQAIALAPNEASYWLNRGTVKEKMKDYTGAYNDFSASIKLDEHNEKAWLSRANLLYKQGQYEEAIKDYDIAIIKYEAYETAYHNRALAKYKLGMNAEACEDLKKAQSLGFEIKPVMLNKICGIQ